MPVARPPCRNNEGQPILGSGRPLDFANLVLFGGSWDEENDDDDDDDDDNDDDDDDEQNQH